MADQARALPCGRFEGTVTGIRHAVAGGSYAVIRGDAPPVAGEMFHAPRGILRDAGIGPGWEGREVFFDVPDADPPVPGRLRQVSAIIVGAAAWPDDVPPAAPRRPSLRVTDLDTLFGPGPTAEETPEKEEVPPLFLRDRWEALRDRLGRPGRGQVPAFRIAAPLVGEDGMLLEPYVGYRVTRRVHLIGRDDGGEARDKRDFQISAEAVDRVLRAPRLSWLRGSSCRRLTRVERENKAIGVRGGSNTLALALGLGIAAGGAAPGVQLIATGRLLDASGDKNEPKILVQPVGALHEKIEGILASHGSEDAGAPVTVVYLPFQKPDHVPSADTPYAGFLVMPIQQHGEMRQAWWDEFETALGAALRRRLAACPNIVLRPVVTLREALGDFGVAAIAPTERLAVPVAAALALGLAGAAWAWAADASHHAWLAKPIAIGEITPAAGGMGRAHAQGNEQGIPVVKPICISRGHPALIQNELLYVQARIDGEPGDRFHTAVIAVPEIHTIHDRPRIFAPVCQRGDPLCSAYYDPCRQSPTRAGDTWCGIFDFEDPKANPDRPPGVGQLWRYFVVAQRERPIDYTGLRSKLEAAFPQPATGSLKQLGAMTTFVVEAFPARQRSFDVEELTAATKDCPALPPARKR